MQHIKKIECFVPKPGTLIQDAVAEARGYATEHQDIAVVLQFDGASVSIPVQHPRLSDEEIAKELKDKAAKASAEQRIR